MPSYRFFIPRLALAALGLAVMLSACSPAPVQTAQFTPAGTLRPTETLPPTATRRNTATAAPTDTPAPTATPRPTSTATAAPTFGPALNGLSAWCLPENEPLSLTEDPASPPASARRGEIVGDALEIRNLPVSACVFIYTFNQPPPDDLKLEIYEHNQKTPWWTAALQPAAGIPNAAAAVLRHTYIIAPPLWDVSFEFAVRDGAGNELRRDTVNLHRWTPELCWNGRYPNPITLRCPLPLDLHPWDAGYGTPIPTFPPEED